MLYSLVEDWVSLFYCAIFFLNKINKSNKKWWNENKKEFITYFCIHKCDSFNFFLFCFSMFFLLIFFFIFISFEFEMELLFVFSSNRCYGKATFSDFFFLIFCSRKPWYLWENLPVKVIFIVSEFGYQYQFCCWWAMI